jgi:hypothetical protein
MKWSVRIFGYDGYQANKEVPVCCPSAFYDCVTVSAATIEAFPVYLICCLECCAGTSCSKSL